MLSNILATCSFFPDRSSLYGTTVINKIQSPPISIKLFRENLRLPAGAPRVGRGSAGDECTSKVWKRIDLIAYDFEFHAAIEFTPFLLIIVAGERFIFAIACRGDTTRVNSPGSKITAHGIGAV